MAEPERADGRNYTTSINQQTEQPPALGRALSLLAFLVAFLIKEEPLELISTPTTAGYGRWYLRAPSS